MDIIQIIWLLLPGLYYGMALWGYLEKKGRSVKKQNPGDFLKQGSFILLAVGATFLVDAFWLESLVAMLPDIMPLLFFRIILLPVMLFLFAKLVGGSKPHAIKPKNRKRSR